MTPQNSTHPDTTFPHDWQVEILEAPPLIAPTRHYVYPQAVEEVERGALQIYLRSRPEAEFAMATFALGFADPSLPHGVWSCPNPRQICAIAGGYAYLVDADRPEKWMQIPYRPVTWVDAAPEQSCCCLPAFIGFGLWERRERLGNGSLIWEGLRVTGIDGRHLHGFGWDMETDSEVPFTVDLRLVNTLAALADREE